MRLNNLAPRFFNPLVSIHKEEYVHIFLTIERILSESTMISMPRSALLGELRRVLQRENYTFDVSDEEGFESSGEDKTADNIAFVVRRLKLCGWIDFDDSGDYASDSLFITVSGKKLAGFLRDLSEESDQSGFVINTYSNLQQVGMMPDNGYVCVRNAYQSTERLLINIEMMYAKIKSYYGQLLLNSKPEDLLESHLDGYIKEVVDKLLFPLKVDDSVDRFKGPILNTVLGILENTGLLREVVQCAVQRKIVSAYEEGESELLRMLNLIKSKYEDIETYMFQLDERNNTYIRITRQKLSYMLTMDTSIKGNLAALLQNCADRDEDYWQQLAECVDVFDVQQISEDSYYKPRRQHVRTRDEEVEIEPAAQVSTEEIASVVEMYGSRFTRKKVNAFAAELMNGGHHASVHDIPSWGQNEYIMSMFLVTNSEDKGSDYTFDADGSTVRKGRYEVPDFHLRKKGRATCED